MDCRNALCLLLVALLVQVARAKVFSRCELAKELLAQGMLKTELPSWTCLIEAESSRNTSAVGGPNSNGSYDYGIFQINSKYWCGKTAKGGDCNMKCSELTDNSIVNDVKCAKKIKARHGFSAWYGWKNKCQGALPDLSKC